MNPIHVSVELKTSDSLIRTGHSALDIESSTYSALNVAVTVKPNVSSVFLCPIRGGYAHPDHLSLRLDIPVAIVIRAKFLCITGFQRSG